MGNPLDDIMSSMDRSSKNREDTPGTSSGTSSSSSNFRIPKRVIKEEEWNVKTEKPPPKKPFTLFGIKQESSSTSSSSSFPTEKTDQFQIFNTKEVQLNSFRIDISRMPSRLRRFSFETFICFQNGKKYDLNFGSIAVSGDVNCNARRLAQYQIFEVFFEKYRKNLFANCNSEIAAYDGAATVYLPEKYFSGEEKIYEILLKKEDFTENQLENIRKIARRREFEFEIKFAPAGKVETSGKALSEVANRQEVVRCAEIVTNFNLNNSKFFQYESAVYPVENHKNQEISTPTTWEMKPGFAKVTKIVDGENGMEMLLTIDPKISPFYKDGPLLKFILGRHAEIHGGFGGRSGGREDRGGFRGGRGGFGGGRYDDRGGRREYEDRGGYSGRDDRGYGSGRDGSCGTSGGYDDRGGLSGRSGRDGSCGRASGRDGGRYDDRSGSYGRSGRDDRGYGSGRDGSCGRSRGYDDRGGLSGRSGSGRDGGGYRGGRGFYGNDDRGGRDESCERREYDDRGGLIGRSGSGRDEHGRGGYDRGHHDDQNWRRDENYRRNDEDRHHSRESDRRSDSHHRNDDPHHHHHHHSHHNRNDNDNDQKANENQYDIEEPTREEIEMLNRAFEAPGIRTTLNSALKDLFVEALHLPKTSNRQFVLTGIAETNADETVFKTTVDGIEKEVSVNEYFLNKYNYRLRLPKLPLVFSKRQKHLSYFPIEMLSVLPGQRIKVTKLTTTIQSEMTGKNAQMPRQQVEIIREILRNSLNLNKNPQMRIFGLKLESESPVEMKAKLLAPPQLRFRGNTYTPEPQRVGFKTNGKFFEPAEIRNLMIIDFDGCLGRQLNEFVRTFERHCENCGIRIDQSSSRWEIRNINSVDHHSLYKEMEYCRHKKVSIVLAVHQEKRPDVHDYLKYFEEKIGVPTIQICLQTAQRMMSSNGKQTVDNVMRKFNLKAGGLNFTVEIPRFFHNRPFCRNSQEMERKLLENSQFIGFEISHGAARSKYDRANGIFSGEPSVVGVSYSLHHSTELGGFSYMQANRQYSLQNLDEKVQECLKKFQLRTKRLPSKLVIYRVGAGEGDFKKISQEVEDIRKSFKKFPNYQPNLLVIMAQKTSHVRIYPSRIEGNKAADQNVPSGACLDNGVTSFGSQEFILVSQAPLIGTIRPVKYTVIVNDMNWTINELSHLTYFRAFGHQVSYGPPAVPDVLYAAENLAKRGRNNWKVYDNSLDLKLTEQAVLARHPEFDTPEMAEQLTAAIIEKLSDSINGMTLTNRNFWA